MSALETWLAYQAEMVRKFAETVEAGGNDLQIVMLCFDRPPGAPLEAPVHMQRLATVETAAEVDALVESAMQDVTARAIDANYQHRILRQERIEE